MDNKKEPSKSRKMPVQKRSKATVDAIIQASTYILMKSGWGGFTTNAIAERAGVNISSLYQFFPNKESIVAELQKRHSDDMRTDLLNTLSNLPAGLTFREVLTEIIDVLVKKHQMEPEVHKVLNKEIPFTVRSVLDEATELRDRLLFILEPHMVNVPDRKLSIYIIGVSIDAVINEVISSRPHMLSEAALTTELVTLLERFLVRPV
ncbi:TetR/AcrR family transcriptional regulator [Marinomonas sp. A3A]|uniref:TetR/AcrR family transcriptional regulator n=1 Tax=Marinomonas sp. A3A TaxID=2065312 RepID=UPI001BB3EC5F|nr:TetR/AcrR family transcriptional regulator [Marinomonas sp. A3A]